MAVAAVDAITLPAVPGPLTRTAHERLAARIVHELAVAEQPAAAR
jgi:hypothetical protein